MQGEREIDERRSALSEHKRALLRERLAGRGRRAAEAAPGIGRRPGEAQDVLSFAQQRLWFLDQLVPGSPFYTESSALRIQAPIDVTAFERALNEIVRRHEVLRTTFTVIDDQPRPVLSPHLHIPVPVVDLSELPETARSSEVVRLATDEARRAFDLEHGPLMRAALLRLGASDWVFLLSLHHIVCDGWSSSVFSRELSRIYSAFAAGRPSPLEELPIQYADFAHWQRGWLSGEVFERQVEYWRRQLADLPLLELPADHNRPAVFSYIGAHHKFEIPRPLAGALERLGQSEGATLFMTLLSGFKTLLHRYTGQDDLAVGVPVANRTHRELENLIGFFVNVLVMRTGFDKNPTHRDMLRRVRSVALDAYAHQDLPFEKLVEDLQPDRDLARNPLFQVIFQLHENPAGASSGDASTLQLIEVDRATVKFDLRVDFFQEAGALQCVIEYSTDLFDAGRIQRLGRHLRTVFEAMVEDPDRHIGDCALVTGSEKATVARWGGVENAGRLDVTIHRRFEEQAARTPDAVAVVLREQKVTYRELDARASAFASDLRARGVGAEELVAVTAEPAVETVISLLGILKAGAAYLPVNSSYPDERLRYMLRDAKARFLVDTGCAAGRYDGFDISILKCGPHSAQSPAPSTGAAPETLAYVMYTSGSTGIPKGVSVTHRGVVRLVTERTYCAMGPDETFLLLAPLTFDATTFEIWGALLNGGRLVLYPEKRVSLEDLEAVLRTERVTTIWLTAGLFNEVVDGSPGALAGIRQLLTGGDVVSPSHVRAHLNRFPGCRVINGYGPTENTTFTCCHVMDSGTMPGAAVPIGTPIKRTHVYVVDRYDQLAPIGNPGELCVAGDGLGRCYLNDPSLTAERFVPDPFDPEGGRRMYRTGDLVRFLPGGELEFLGRADRQLKIRGFRVEPGEIEKRLLEHPSLQNAIVIARDGASEGKRLTAYVVPRTPEPQDSQDPTWQETEKALTDDWRTLYEDLYSGAAHNNDPTFDISGWKATDSGLPIPADEMREWLNRTVERILEHKPSSVLEIGCGTGLLAFRLVPRTNVYVGADFSRTVIDRLRSAMAQAGLDSTRVTLLTQPADNFENIERRAFDVVVLNSVIQYFPGADYLLRVLGRTVEAVKPGGTVFIGDIRSLPHLEAFHSRVQLARAEAGLDCAELLHRIEKSVQLEQELLVDPGFFEELPLQIPRVTHVDVQWKRGLSDNELTRYRYDAILHIDAPQQQPRHVRELEWVDSRLNPGRLRELLLEAREDVVAVHGVPNDRIQEGTCVWGLLKGECGAGPVEQLRERVLEQSPGEPLLEEFWQLAEGTSYVARVRPSGSVWYVRRNSTGGLIPCCSPGSRALPRPAPNFRNLTNNPMKSVLADRLGPKLRKHLQERLPEYMLPSSYVVLEALPLTRNGKVDRDALASLGAERPAVGTDFVPARDDIEQRLAKVWSDVLGVERVGIHDNFFELGGDSILCIQVISRAKSAGVHITVKQIFENQTIAGLAAAATTAAVVHAEQRPISGPTRLTPAQAWLLDQNLPRPDHFNQSVLLEVPRTINAAALDRALRAVLHHHDGLRLRCERRDGQWHAFYAPPDGRPVLEKRDLARALPSRRKAELEKQCAAVQAGLNLATGPVIRAVLYDMGPLQPARLLLALHHFTIDGVSWRILLEDLWAAHAQAAAAADPGFVPKTTSMHYWAGRLAEHANSEELRSEVRYWLGVPPSEPHSLPVDFQGSNTVASVRIVEEHLTEDETQAVLVEIPRALRTQVNDVLLYALVRTLERWTGRNEVCFDLEGHGREALFNEVDLSRTIGWFTSIFPVTLSVDNRAEIRAALMSVKDQLQAIPKRGAGFGALRFLSADGKVREQLSNLPRRDLSFNYLGQFGGAADPAATIRGAAESPGPMRDPAGTREYLIEVDGSVAYNRMSFNWSYSENRHARQTIEELARGVMQELRTVIQHCRSEEAVRLTPEDFPAAGLGQEDLDRLLARLKQS